MLTKKTRPSRPYGRPKTSKGMVNNEQSSNFEPSRHENSKARPQNNGPRNYQHLFDKYMNLARDALSCGDRVAAEYHYQHADHYLRVLNERQQNQRPSAHQQPDRHAGRHENSPTHPDVETAPENKIESEVEQPSS